MISLDYAILNSIKNSFSAMYKSINQAITGFLCLTLAGGILGSPAIAQSVARPGSPLKFKVIGAIARPGSYLIAPETPRNCDQASLKQRYQDNSFEIINRCLTISRAIQIAGGITPAANVRQISIHRLQANNSSKTITIDLWQFLKFGGSTQALLLQDGDTITIPTATNTAFVAAPQETSTTSVTNITVLGDVVHPSNFILPANATLNQALLAAGGLNRDRANRKNIVVVLHLNSNGSTTSQVANINTLLKVEAMEALVIRNNDIVVIASYSGSIRNSTRIILDSFSDLQVIGFIPN